MPTEKTWQQWLERLYNLRRDKRGSHERPHKPVLLLAILDLLDHGLVTRNEFPLNPDLTKTFKHYFEVVRQGDDQPTIENPFYHLSGDGFWQLVPKPGERPLYEPGNASRAPTITALRQIYGRFDDALWAAFLTDAHSRHLLREALIARYFPEKRDQLAAIAGEQPAAPKEDALREQLPGRDAAFRTTILDLYDHTCAACGLRVKLQDGFSLMDAAHIIPFRLSRNDKPDNGLALCPNHHRAMDELLIAPCPHPDLKAGIWRLSKRLDERRDSRKDLISLRGKPVLEPTEPKFYPARKSLEWREQHLSVKY
jgi:putative restriction endonuclease